MTSGINIEVGALTGLANLRSKLGKKFDYAARKTGSQYNIYRPTSIQNVLDPSNLIGQQAALFVLNIKGTGMSKEPFQDYVAYTDFTQLQPGDVLNNGVETFTIVWDREIDLPIAQKADFLCEVWRIPAGATWVGNERPAPVRYAINVPASFSSKPSMSDYSITNVKQSAQAVVWDVRIWTAAENLTTQDQLHRTSDGLKLMPMTIQNNHHSQILTCREVA